MSNTVRSARPGDHAGSPLHAAGVTDPVARLVDLHNDLPHVSLMDGGETPAEGCVRKQAPKDATAEETGEDSHANAWAELPAGYHGRLQIAPRAGPFCKAVERAT